MVFLKLAFVIVLIDCYVSSSMAQGKFHFNVTFNEFQDMCQKKAVHYFPHFFQAHDDLEYYFYHVKPVEVNETYEADFKLLIRRLLNATLLCFDENNLPSNDEIENIVNESLPKVFAYHKLVALEIEHFECLRNLSDCGIQYDHVMEDAMGSFLPLPLTYTGPQCNYITHWAHCFVKKFQENCESSVANQYKANYNEYKSATGCN